MLLINDNWYKCDDIPDIINIVANEYNQELAHKLKEFYLNLTESEYGYIPQCDYDQLFCENMRIREKLSELQNKIQLIESK